MVVYLITNKINGKQYIGKTVTTTAKRWHRHCAEVKKGSNTPLHNAIRKYGTSNFRIDPLMSTLTTNESLCLWEQELIGMLLTKRPNGYNVTDGGDGSTGYKHSEEVRQKIKAKRALQVFPAGYSETMSKATKGRVLTPEHRQRISEALKGNRNNPSGRGK